MIENAMTPDEEFLAPVNYDFGNNITPTDEQNKAIRAVVEWFHNSPKQHFYIGGFAGAGKTSIIKPTVAACGIDPNSSEVVYGSFTGKAASVMRKKGLGAKTIHSLIYRLVEDHYRQPVFQRNPDSIVSRAKLVVLDECSMINETMADDLLHFGVKILVFGDPGQLPPVQGHGKFTRTQPDFFLREIHRQAAENPIINVANLVRQGTDLSRISFDRGDDRFQILPRDCDSEFLLNADQILTGKNNTRRQINEIMKSHYGFEDFYPIKPGVKVICLRNHRDYGIFNGNIFTTADFGEIGEDKRSMTQTLYDADIDRRFLARISLGNFDDYNQDRSEKQREDDYRYMLDNRLAEFDYAYGITVHKSQGSQWNSVCLWDDQFLTWKKEERRKWLYTAITRAEERMVVIDG